MKRKHLIVIGILAVVVFACAFGGSTYALGAFGPATPGQSATVAFTVSQGETDAQVQSDLQQAGLISNAMAFKLLLKLRYKDAGFQAGVYHLSPGMTMDEIINLLINGEPLQQIAILIPPGLRIEQYPALFQNKLPLFDSKAFLQIATTGKYADGSTVTSKYWFVEPKQKQAVNALEGYLIPNTYNFTNRDDAAKAVDRLLDAFGENLCPGPASNPTEYIYNKAQCKAHATKIKGTSIFTLMEKSYFTTNDTLALYDALTIASITMREISHTPSYANQVATLYYNRYLNSLGKVGQPTDPGSWGCCDEVANLGSDPTAAYARDTDTPPSNGAYWKELGNAGSQIATKNPYNTDVATNKGLTPGPISAPIWQWIEFAANPRAYTDPNAANSYFFFFTHCGKAYFYRTYTTFQNAWNSFGQAAC